MKLISIIVPVYNVEKYLGECIDSILSQTYQNLELVLVDDGSPDNSGKICDEYADKDKRIRAIHKENGGVSSARNVGLDAANGEYITFVDSDDLIDKRYLELMYNKIEETSSDMCFCHFDRFDENSCEEQKENIPQKLNVDFNSEAFVDFAKRFFDIKNNVFGSSCRTLYKKSCVESLRFNSKIKISEDLVFVLNALFNSNSICSIPNVLYHYRTNMNSAGKTYKKGFLESQLELKNELDLLIDRFDAGTAKNLSKSYYCLLCYYLFSNEYKFRKNNDNYKEQLRKIKESELYSYFSLKNILHSCNVTIKQKVKYLIIWIATKK